MTMNRERWIVIAALSLPTVVALLAPRAGIGGAPSKAQAFNRAPGAGVVASLPAAPKPTGVQNAALERARELAGGGAVESPFLEPTEESAIPADVPGAPVGWESRLSEMVKLSTVFGGARGDAAVINGKFYSVGSEIIEGVTIESIDVAGRSVVVVISDGERYQLTMAARREDPTVVTRLED